MKTLIIVAAVVCGCAAKPMSDWWHSLSAGDGQYVLTKDRSYERGGVADWSLEYVRPYSTAGATGAATKSGIPGITHYNHASSEELFYYLQQQGTQGAPHTARVKALSDMLNTGLVDVSDNYYHYLKLKADPKFADGKYFMDASGEIYYKPSGATQGQGK